MSSNISSSRQKSKLILCVFLALVCARFFALKSEFDHVFLKRMFAAQENGVEYQVWRGDGESILHVGDLLGTNIISAGKLKDLRPPEGQKAVVIPSLHPASFHDVTPESLMDILANARDVVLVDNFCRDNWEQVKEHAWYQNTSLSPGPYCLSEPETQLIDRLIKQYGITRVNIYADNKLYVRLIDTFLKYLQGMRIPYQIIYKP